MEDWELGAQVPKFSSESCDGCCSHVFVASLLICSHVECNSEHTLNALIFGINLFITISVIFVQGDHCNQKAVCGTIVDCNCFGVKIKMMKCSYASYQRMDNFTRYCMRCAVTFVFS